MNFTTFISNYITIYLVPKTFEFQIRIIRIYREQKTCMKTIR